MLHLHPKSCICIFIRAFSSLEDLPLLEEHVNQGLKAVYPSANPSKLYLEDKINFIVPEEIYLGQ